MSNTHAHSYTSRGRINQPKYRFSEQIRIMRKQQEVLRKWSDPASTEALQCIERILQGERGVRYSAAAKGKQETSFILARNMVKQEDAALELEKVQEAIEGRSSDTTEWDNYQSATLCAHDVARYVSKHGISIKEVMA
ncbi:hypothetical protein [Aeromonas veronii]|uniref:hypothetical protein n=1 Tax=Aeromonas veronii TaxID=654 RepID=UPI0007186658|nr:hypothetical protein [Aeromonas veronii]KRV85125.1 hypothetical protein AO718_17410 [Aeromonas veronii]KRW00430.1 hypothetical protein AO725_17785 [Aeromonas veronii]KRW10812.1 hypothetical protein AO745_16840 [Aeromonas veronii]KRW12969.1 hypothetical protein AO722_10150 [Aeromonas veronii]KRW15760.1 hypothetical protein AO732_00685 [Aeromonas veronii]